VIQKHAARRLHYDFRLELDGVLKSWAVPQGPSMDPGDKRLAVHVEDHPLAYGGFEGIIPKGQYGGGTVMLWDRGWWQPIEDPVAGYAKGKLKFRLHGERLQGGFTLVRMRGEGGKNWLLIKERDESAGQQTGEERSVASGRSMDEIAAAPERVWHSNRADAPRLDPGALAGAVAAAMPLRLSPMLASLAKDAPGGDDWIHEIKFDGYRLLARVEAGGCTLFTRNGHDWTAKFPAIAAACAALPCDQAWLDGEVVALDHHGISRFHDLQSALSEGRDAGLVYHLFDLVHLDGFDLFRVGLEERKGALKDLLGGAAPPLRYTDHLDGRGEAFRRQACAFALEGIISKRRGQPYRPGRAKTWLKVKCTSRQEFVVAGWVPPQGRRTGVGAMLIGIYGRAGAFTSCGRVGTGFGEREAARLEQRLSALVRPDPPFPSREKGVTWVEPRLVIEVEFSEWTPDGQLRHPSYQGIREDKEARDVVREGVSEEEGRVEGAGGDRLARFHLTSPDKVLYPDQGLTKRALAEYYLDAAPWILPHIAGRALVLVRCPEGATKSCFYQRHPHPGMPKAIRRFPDDDETLLGVDDVEGLVGLVQMGALEIHSWGSATRDIERPDILVFDLDPDEGLPWPKVTAGASEIRDRLGALGLASFVKTTGGKGVHVVVPLKPKAEWPEAKAFCKALAEAVAGDSPDSYTATITKARRKGRIFIDYLRNQRGATFVAPYSTRSRPGAPVAVPITWAELEGGIQSGHFTVETLFRRLSSLPADPWKDLREAARELPANWEGLI
jgi:bifunctional non-homologous end joining protein LigD